jgi:hypothetical protein
MSEQPQEQNKDQNQEQNQPPQDGQQPQEEPKKQTKSILEFIKPEVAQQLQEMGYSKNVSEKACLFTNSNIDQALDWIFQHSSDPDFEEEAKVEVSEDQKPKVQMSKEEAAIKAKELQQKMRKMHEEKQKELDREHERLRIQNAKEMAKAREAEKERQARLFVEQKKKRDKEEAEHRRQVLEELERDKAERLGKKYVPPEQKQKVYTKEENIQYYIKSIKTVYNPFRAGDTLKICFKTLKIMLSNVVKNPNEDKFKTIKLSNPNVHERVGKISIALKLLEELGFVKNDEVMVVTNVDMDLFNKTIGYLENELAQLE